MSLAQQNIRMQESIDEARTHVAIVRSGDYVAAKDVFDDLYRRQEAVCAKLGPAVLLQSLRQEADKVGCSHAWCLHGGCVLLAAHRGIHSM